VLKQLIFGCVLGVLGLFVAGCSEPAKDNTTPKYQGKDYKYHSPGAQGYGPPNAVRKADE
jgi:hypothetical protein